MGREYRKKQWDMKLLETHLPPCFLFIILKCVADDPPTLVATFSLLNLYFIKPTLGFG